MFTNNQLISNILHFCLFQKEKWQKHYLQLISNPANPRKYIQRFLFIKENPNEEQKHSSSAFGKKQLVITTIFNSRSYFL